MQKTYSKRFKKDVYEGEVICPNCGDKYILNTVQLKLFEKPNKCFKCFMDSGYIPLKKKEL